MEKGVLPKVVIFCSCGPATTAKRAFQGHSCKLLPSVGIKCWDPLGKEYGLTDNEKDQE